MDYKMRKILLTRIRKEKSSVVGNEHQQGTLIESSLYEAKKKTIRWHHQQVFSEETEQQKNIFI